MYDNSLFFSSKICLLLVGEPTYCLSVCLAEETKQSKAEYKTIEAATLAICPCNRASYLEEKMHRVC